MNSKKCIKENYAVPQCNLLSQLAKTSLTPIESRVMFALVAIEASDLMRALNFDFTCEELSSKSGSTGVIGKFVASFA